MSKTVDKTKLEIGTHPPTWCRKLSIDEENSIRDIYKFFVVNTPCKDTSAMSIPLTQYGWDYDNPPKDGYIQKRFIDSAKLVKDSSLFIGNQREDMKALFATAAMSENFADTCSANRIAILVSSNFIMDLFKNIRNALAHCRFTIKQHEDDILFVMENGAVTGSNCEVKSRMVLKKSTLEEWINIIQNEAPTEKDILRKELEKLKNQIIVTITNNEIKSISQLATAIGVEAGDISRFKKENKGVIEYSRHEQKWVLCKSEGT